MVSDRRTHAAAPVVGKSVRYCNPLPLETSSRDGSPQGVGLGDVTVVREGDSYYLFGTGGGAWVSRDFVNWKYQAVEVRGGRLPVAPHVVKYNGAFYMSGNDAPLYKAPNILGPYEVLGPWKNEKGEPWTITFNGRTANGAFDVDMFVDDDNKPYMYFPGRSTAGIYVAPLDPKDLTRLAAAPKHLFAFDPSHVWERWGERNEYTGVAWIEGPWVFKRNGTYYMEYSASGTQWMSYASGFYSAKSPLGPFTYSPRNPFLRKTTGIVTGPGHGSVVQGPDGNWWVFYTIVMANPPGGRRIGMDPIGFDANGNPFTRGPSDTPQWAPGVVPNPVRDGDSGSIPVSINKVRAMRQQGVFSSERPGREAAYAVDDSNGTMWQPAENDAQPTLTIDLSASHRVRERSTMDDRFQPHRVRGRRRIRQGRRPWRCWSACGHAGDRRVHDVPLQDRSVHGRETVHHRLGQDEQPGHAVHGVRRDSAHPLPLRPPVHDGLAAPRNNAPWHHRVHCLWEGCADPDALGRGMGRI